jgi:hypothetical protein
MQQQQQQICLLIMFEHFLKGADVVEPVWQEIDSTFSTLADE